jgi:dihydroorotate dehydrogenase electron transfer subunit
MPIHRVQASVIESQRIEPDLHWLRLGLAQIGPALRPGQFLTLLVPERLDPYLPTPLFPTHIAAEEIGGLFAPGERERWLQTIRQGDLVQVMGPLGRPFALDGTTRNLLLVAEGLSGLPLIALAQDAASRKMEVSFCAWHAFSRAGLLPAGLLPPAVEYRSGVGQEALTSTLSETLPWASQVCAAGSTGLYGALSAEIRRTRLHYADGFCQVMMLNGLMCGQGLCGQCHARLKRRLVQVCTEGPVFDLKQVL